MIEEHFLNKKDLKKYLHRLEEAEKRDHRKLGKQLDFFHMQEEAPGMVFWHPNGWTIYQVLEQYMRKVQNDAGYQEIKTPQVVDRVLWEKSGHWDKYQENIFATESEKRTYAVKPMNCPGHCLMFKGSIRSHRDLPMRFADFGVLHRNELSGALTGLTRVRRFQQDDAHIFCTEEQIQPEVSEFIDLLHDVYADFGTTFIAVNYQDDPLRADAFVAELLQRGVDPTYRAIMGLLVLLDRSLGRPHALTDRGEPVLQVQQVGQDGSAQRDDGTDEPFRDLDPFV